MRRVRKGFRDDAILNISTNHGDDVMNDEHSPILNFEQVAWPE
jgi:hypothetical protein